MQGEVEEESILWCKEEQRENQFVVQGRVEGESICSAMRSRGRINLQCNEKQRENQFVVQGEVEKE